MLSTRHNRVVERISRGLLHTTAVKKAIPRPRIIAKIDTHEFHKVIKLVMPDRLKPWDPRKSCDLRTFEEVDPNWLKVEYRPFAGILDKLPDEQRKVFTVGFGKRGDGTRVILEDYLAKTRRHKYDVESLDFKVTWATWKIRNFQELFRTTDNWKDGRLVHDVRVLIQKRKKWLNQMRHQDYKRFEWIIEVLGVMYKLQPENMRLERKASLDVLVAIYCNEMRDKKMAEYKAELEEQKVPFLKGKLETLQAIREDEVSVGLESSVDEDIRRTRSLLLKLEKGHLTVYPEEEVKSIEGEVGK